MELLLPHMQETLDVHQHGVVRQSSCERARCELVPSVTYQVTVGILRILPKTSGLCE